MSSIRHRLFFILTIFGGTSLALAFSTYLTFQQFQRERKQLELSYLVRDKIQDLSAVRPQSPVFDSLLDSSSELLPPRRAKELKDLLDTIAKGNPRATRDHHQVFLKNEAEFRRVTRDQLNYFEERLVYLWRLGLMILAIGFVGLQLFVNLAVIRPMRDLSRKMVDFLYDRYTYQFSVPSSDEVGHMQATFNSLAQRVITNLEQLRTLDQAKSEFLSIASHELRTPLTSIKGSLSLMRSGVVGKMNEMAENLLTIAETETDRLIRLINDILDLAKIEAQKLPLHQDWGSLNKLVEVSLTSLQGLSGQAGVQLKAEVIPMIEAYMDNDRMQQVLTNLLSNAIKFSPKGECVIVRTEITAKNELRVEVRDHGRGIDPQDQEAIFQKFRQASNEKNPLVKGTGLGLAIARALVEQHGGEIGVSSVVGEGSTFFFILPEWRFSHQARTEASA